MHQRIKELYDEVRSKHLGSKHFDLIIKDLYVLSTTRTEAWIVLVKGYEVDKDEAERLIRENDLWDDEDYVDIMYQVALYLKEDFENLS